MKLAIGYFFIYVHNLLPLTYLGPEEKGLSERSKGSK